MEPQKEFFPANDDLTQKFDRNITGRYAFESYTLARFWKQAAKRNYFYLLLCSVCVIAVLVVTLMANFKVYTVRVDNATGAIDAAQELKAVPYKPQQKEIQYFLGQFVRNIRTIPLDPIVYKSNWKISQSFLTNEAATKLQELTSKDKQIEKLGRSTVQVTIKSIQVQPGTQNTYQVRWQEEEFSIGGAPSGKKTNYVALFSVRVIPPTKEEELTINPLGLKISDLTFAKES